MLAYEIRIAGEAAERVAERVRAALEASCGETVEPALPVGDDARLHAILLPPGVEWTFERLREVVTGLRTVADGCSVSLAGMPEDDDELVAMLLRQAAMLATHGHEARAAGLRREALRLQARG